MKRRRNVHRLGSIEWNRRGTTREVLLVGRWAIKVPTWRHGLRCWCHGVLANYGEREWSGFRQSMLKPNPVLWSSPGALINVYRRARPCAIRPHWYDWTPWGDAKSANLGVVDGRVVIVDYGHAW